jgi:hypothetical protein
VVLLSLMRVVEVVVDITQLVRLEVQVVVALAVE